MFGIPDKYFWPGLIITLLASSVIWWVGMLFVAKSGDGPQVVENYYQRSVDHEDVTAARRAAVEVGWKLDVDWSTQQDQGVRLHVVDQSGEPVEGIEGSVELRRPEIAGAFGRSQLEPVEGHPGSYQIDIAPDRSGLWDVVVEADHSGQQLRYELRQEVAL